MPHARNYCDGLARRDFLKVGTAGMFGMGLGLPELLARQAQAGATSKSDVSLIILFLKGGLSTIDTLDMKPGAPAEFRGEFDPIDSNVPGIQVGEHIPRIARCADKFSLVRSFTHPDSNHGSADHYMLTGYAPNAAFNPGLSPNNQAPAHGSVISKKLGPRGSIPPYVALPRMHSSGGSSYLGAVAAPFVIEADPNAPGFAVPDMMPPLDLAAARLDSRRNLLAQVDRYQKSAEASANANAKSVGVFREKAFELMTSREAKEAFNLHAEPEKLRDEYGRTSLGQSCLMARRLVEAGVRCVTIDHTNWDTHDNNFNVLKKELLPAFDAGVSSLFRDLADRGLLDTTMVVVTGEFGRTPKINNNAGRDHWGPCFTVMLGGGGIQGGRVVGKSDAWANRPTDNPYRPEDLAATMYRQLGINPEDEFHTPDGRPHKIVNDGKPIRELF